MPVDTLDERIGMLAEFGFLVEYARAGIFTGVMVQAVFDTSHNPVGQPPLFEEISSVGPTLLLLASDVPNIFENDLFRLDAVEGVGPNPEPYEMVDFHPATADGVYLRVVLSVRSGGLTGGLPGDPTIPT